ncbi:uncharacterized protein [Dermacentor albipictus]|uniref:uncharacterized protein isoform X15 n=1 Tax=Dermacentor albipictus TaxID=60249 RepID=UPI0038FCAF63
MQYNQGYGGGYGAKTPQAFSPHDAYGVPQHPGAYGGQAPEYGGYQGYPGYPGYQGYQPPSSDLDDSGTPYTTDQFSPQGYAAQGYGAMPGYMPQGGGEYEQSSALQTTRGATGVRDISSATHPSYTSRTGVTSSESTPRTPRGASGQAPAIVVVPRASGAKRAFTLVLGISAVVFIGTVLVIAARLMLLKSSERAVKITTTPKPVRVEHQNLRPPLLFCTVGYTFEDDQDLLGSELPCDYLIYSDLIANNGTFAPLYGTRSWDAYKTVSQALGMATLTAGGVSFTLSEGAGQNSTLDVIQQRDQIVKSFITDRMLALGAFDYEPTAGVPLSKLKDFFKYLNKTLPSQDPASMVFLGVFLATNVIADAFIADISQIPEISTLILETHITLRQAHLGGHTDCHAYPISAVGIKNLANNTVPRLRALAGGGRARGEPESQPWRHVPRRVLLDHGRHGVQAGPGQAARSFPAAVLDVEHGRLRRHLRPRFGQEARGKRPGLVRRRQQGRLPLLLRGQQVAHKEDCRRSEEVALPRGACQPPHAGDIGTRKA